MSPPRVLIIEARYYNHIADNLLKGATRALKAKRAKIDRITIGGIYEIPAAVSYVLKVAERHDGTVKYDGIVVLGCAIKGETDHYENISSSVFQSLLDISTTHNLALGGGILTVRNEKQAMERARPERRDFGGQAARACLRMIELKRELGLTPR